MKKANKPVSVLKIAIALLLVACGDSSTKSAAFRAEPYEPVHEALRTAGLRICGAEMRDGSIAGDYEFQGIHVTTTGICPASIYSSPGHVVVRSFNSAATRDEAATSGFGDSLIYWVWGDKVISVVESSRPEEIAAMEKAMSSLRGARKALDKR